MNIKRWELSPINRPASERLAKQYDLPYALAALLAVRGFNSPQEIQGMLEEEPLSDPFQMLDMDKAVKRIEKALDDFERIAIYGDYDADGITSTAMLYIYLRDRGANVSYYIPQRDSEGYGMNRTAVELLAREGVDLIITVDNGVSAIDEIAYAKTLGMDVVVTDHHQPHENLPQACAIVDAHQAADKSPFKKFSGAGVVLKLLIALEGGAQELILEEFADLAAVGTVGDSVPLLGENRTIVRRGLQLMERRDRPGLDALLDLGSDHASATKLSFSVVPCINATGRMGAPQRAVRLLTYEPEDEPGQVQALAQEIRGENDLRKRVEAEITAQAVEKLMANKDLRMDRVIVVEGTGWHHGVVGIVAARITERFGKPCLVLSIDEDGTARGSGRSVEGFSMFAAVSSCQDLLIRYGGHPMAAGVTLQAGNIPEFRRRLNLFARDRYPNMPAPSLRLDCMLNPSNLTLGVVKDMLPLQPFGAGNPQPMFGIFGAELKAVHPLGSSGNHCRLRCAWKGFSFDCLRFGVGAEAFPFEAGDQVDLAVNLEIDNYRRDKGFDFIVRDMKLAAVDPEQNIFTLQAYEKLFRQDPLSQGEAKALLPTRNQLAALYRQLAKESGRAVDPESLLGRLASHGFSLGMLLLSLDVLEERELIAQERQGEKLVLRLLPQSGKVQIFDSPLFARLR